MKKKKVFTKVLAYGMVVLMLSVFGLDILTVVLGNKYEREFAVTAASMEGGEGKDQLHFLNTGNSDAILIESNGRFALVDAGNGSDNPRGEGYGRGYEKEVLAYLNKVARGADGKVHLDFILGTHDHYDHVGGFKQIISDPGVVIDKAYFKVYDPLKAKKYEATHWGLQTMYDEIQIALKEKKIPCVSDIPAEPFPFGNFTLQFLNTDPDKIKAGAGENDNSIGVKVTKGETAAFLAGDLTNHNGLEQSLADEIGQVDLLKLGHHGYFGATTMGFLRVLKPKIAIATNWLGKIYPNVKWNLTMVSHAAMFATADNDGILATFQEEGGITLQNHIH